MHTKILEKTVERQREELKTERVRRHKTEKTIMDYGQAANQVLSLSLIEFLFHFTRAIDLMMTIM